MAILGGLNPAMKDGLCVEPFRTVDYLNVQVEVIE